MRDELLRAADVQREYGVSESTLATWRERTRESGVQIGPVSQPLGPRRVVYRRSDVETWVAAEAGRVAS